MSYKKQKTILIGVTGGIAAFKTLELIALLKKEDLNIVVIMTHSATHMISPEEFERASANKVYVELFEKEFDYKRILKTRTVDHIQLADSASLFAIVPATANTIAKLTHGVADDFLTTTALATKAPILIFPSMNVNMWHNPIVQENITTIKKHGLHVINPSEGPLACGYEGKGRLPDILEIKKEIMKFLTYSRSLQGKKIIVTAGGTREPIDDIRSITNKSSGKMGAALADECFLRGADVLLLRSKYAVEPRYAIRQQTFETSADLFELIKNTIRQHDCIFHTAAVSDFSVQNKKKGKIPSNTAIRLSLIPSQKIIHEIKQWNPSIKLIAFKAEYGLQEQELLKKARIKMESSRADCMVANDVSKINQGFGSDTNEVFMLLKNKTIKIPLNTKQRIASSLIDLLANEAVL